MALHSEKFKIGEKISFSVTIDGIDRNLFSVVDKGKMGLLIGQGTSKQMEYPYGVKRDYKNQHYSVHPSNNDIDTSVTQKTVMQDGTEYSAVSLVRNTKQNLLWLVYARRLPILEKATRVLQRKRYAAVVHIGNVDTTKETLFYSVLVSRPSIDLSILTEAGWEFYTAAFDHFMIIVIPMLLQYPTHPEGDILQFLTSPPITNKIFPPNHQQQDSESIPTEGLLTFIGIYMHTLKDLMIARMNNLHLEPILLEVCKNAPFCRSFHEIHSKFIA